jgi:transcription-repair coupling factor (superfamily II helicase)
VVDFFGLENGWFVTTKDLFETNINWAYHVRKNSLLLNRNKDIAPEICITSLIDAGYIHSAHLAKSGTYKKDGHTISIRPPSEDIVIALSFFDTIIDEILIFDTHGQFLTKKENISLSSIIDKRIVEEVEKRTTLENKELFSFLLDTQIIFMDLDFWDALGEVANDCRNSIIFCGSTTDISVDIAIKDPKIASLQDLELLVKNLGKNVSFYTKHTKALLNFLEYNNLLC